MDGAERHAYGAHYTAEADILRIVGPTIIRPWTQEIDAAGSMKQLLELRARLAKFTVLDPACGSGNFLYVCYRELSRLDQRIFERIRALVSPSEFAKQVKTLSVLSPKQFFGIEYDTFGLELAKVTLMLAKKLAFDEAKAAFGTAQGELALQEEGLPLDNLDANFRPGDALFQKWPEVDAVIGNPPYQSKNKRQGELEAGYQLTLRQHFPDVDGRADYCTYWFRKAHDPLKPGTRAGLVGTNTIRQNYSREASLDYILDHDGTITEAVSSMVWPGEAVVHISIVNWIKGQAVGQKQLFFQEGNKAGVGERKELVNFIGPALDIGEDVTKAKALKANKRAPCFQGQTHGHVAFLLRAEDARSMIASSKASDISKVLHPFLIANEVVGMKVPKPRRYVIDFSGLNLLEAQHFPELLKRIESKTLPARQAAANKEAARNKQVLAKNPDAKMNVHHARFLETWWQLSYSRERMVSHIRKLPRYIVCGQVTKRPIFTFVHSSVRPNAALQVFGYADDYTFGILQSSLHWEWFTARCSTMKSDPRYTSNTVWDSFQWPQKPSVKSVQEVAMMAVAFRGVRDQLAKKHNRSYRELYRTLELPGEHPLKVAQEKLDLAVRRAYDISAKSDIRLALLKLNRELFELEKNGASVRSGGLPEYVKADSFVSDDAITK